MYNVLRRSTLTLYFTLLATLFGMALAFGPEQLGAAVFLGFAYCIGLLIICRGLIQGRQRSYIWLCFILLIYFVAVVQALFFPSVQPQLALEWFLLSLIVMTFCTAMYASRLYPAE